MQDLLGQHWDMTSVLHSLWPLAGLLYAYCVLQPCHACCSICSVADVVGRSVADADAVEQQQRGCTAAWVGTAGY
jgi:hypothetical protein